MKLPHLPSVTTTLTTVILCMCLYQGARADTYQHQIVVRFAEGSHSLRQWQEQGRTGEVDLLRSFLGSHTTRGYISNAVVRLAIKRAEQHTLNARARSKQPPSTPNATSVNAVADICVVEYTADIEPHLIARKLSAQHDIQYAEPMPFYEIVSEPNDPQAATQYHLKITHATDAWDIPTTNTEPVIVGVVDTGIDTLHEDLQGQLWHNPGETGVDSYGRDKRFNKVDDDDNGFLDDWYGWDFVGSNGTTEDNAPLPGNGHGTHVAGLVGAVVNNNLGVAGMATHVRLMPVKVGRDNPFATSVERSGDAILYAASMGASIINCSFGSSSPSFASLDVVNAATELGALIVAAAGNASSQQAFYPAAHEPALSVAATDESDVRASFSNYHSTVDVSAPGVSILSTMPGNDYATQDGTSMASPIVAGAAAQIKFAFPHITPQEMHALIKATTDNVDSLNESFAGMLGTGRINVLSAVTNTKARFAELVDVVFADENGDGVFLGGERIIVSCRLHNILADLAQARLTLTSGPSEFLPEFDVVGADVGFVPKNDTATPKNSFSLTIPADAPSNSQLNLMVWIWDADTLVAKELIQRTVNPNYRTLHENAIGITVTSSGTIGYNDYPSNSQGDGFTWNNSSSLLFESGFLIGTEPTYLPNAVRGADPNYRDYSFKGYGIVDLRTDSIPSGTRAVSYFTDQNDRYPLGLSVKQTVYESTDDTLMNSVLLSYDITNTTTNTISNICASQFFDWDISASGARDGVAWDNQRGFAVVQNVDDPSMATIGVAMLSGMALNIVAMDNQGGGGVPSIYDGFIRAEKWLTMARGKLRTNSTIGDISLVIGGGPFSLESGQTRQLVFAISAAHTLEDVTRYMTSVREHAMSLGLSAVPYVPSAEADHIEYATNAPVYSVGDQVTIKFSLANITPAEIHVVDMMGRTVATPVIEHELAGGTYVRTFEMPDGASGVYFFVLKTLNSTDALPVQLLR